MEYRDSTPTPFEVPSGLGPSSGHAAEFGEEGYPAYENAAASDGVPGWFELRCVEAGIGGQGASDPIRCLAFDKKREIVYAGTNSGMLHAQRADDLSRIGSIATHASALFADPGVRSIAASATGAVVAACPDGVRVFTRGCAPRAKVVSEVVSDSTSVVLNPMNDAQAAVGTGGNSIALVDWDSMRVIRQSTLRAGSRVTCSTWVDVAHSGSVVVLATGTGRLSLCDPSSMREVNAAAAFLGPVTSVASRAHILAACGMSVRGGISYLEPHVKLFDVRSMAQPLLSAPFPSGPICACFDEWVSTAITGGEALWALSPDGVLQCLEISGLQSGQGVMPVSQEIRVDAENDSLTALVVSPEGLIVCGDTGGFLHEWSASEQAKVNAESEPLWDGDGAPPSAIPPPSRIRLRHLEINEHGATIPLALFPADRELASNVPLEWAGMRVRTPRLRMTDSSIVRTAPSRKQGSAGRWESQGRATFGGERTPFSRFPPRISPKVLASANWQDFVAYAKAPLGFVRNSTQGYEPEPIWQMSHKTASMSSASRRMRSRSPPAGRIGQPSTSLASLSLGEKEREDSKTHDGKDAALDSPTGRSRYVEMDLVAWESVEGFDFLRYNRSQTFCGLENALPNVYVNPVIQALFFIPPFRDALAHDVYDRDSGISCELGFLFKMLDAGGADLAVETGNFTKAFMTMANAGALGLLDGSAALPLTSRIESFTRYLLEQLHKDAGGERTSTVSTLAGADAVSYGKFSQSQTTWERRSRMFQHTLQYDNAPDDFPGLVKQSLCREHEPTRAFCAESGSFESMSQRREIESLPNLLLLDAGSRTQENHASWWSSPNPGGTVSTPVSVRDQEAAAAAAMARPVRLCASLHIEIGPGRGEVAVTGDSANDEENDAPTASLRTPFDPVDEQSTPVEDTGDTCADYELAFVIAHVPCTANTGADQPPELVRNPDGHLVAYVRVPRTYGSGREANASWWCFNDFVIGPCEGGWKEVAAFTPAWKQPCVMGYVRKDIGARIPPVPAPRAPDLRSILGSGPCNAALGVADDEALPGKGSPVGLDCEFVMTAREDCEIWGNGHRAVITPARFALARVSVVRGYGPLKNTPLIDDYVEVKEDIVDYLTRFSGISDGDLVPSRSPYQVRQLKHVYRKLLALVDVGVVFVGHGLKKDLRVLNFAVPSSQVVDTVVLFRNEGRRLMSLRYLVATLLGSEIQNSDAHGHDSVEDALAAMQLYDCYEKLQVEGRFGPTLSALYKYGYAHGWRLNPETPFVTPPSATVS